MLQQYIHKRITDISPKKTIPPNEYAHYDWSHGPVVTVKQTITHLLCSVGGWGLGFGRLFILGIRYDAYEMTDESLLVSDTCCFSEKNWIQNQYALNWYAWS